FEFLIPAGAVNSVACSGGLVAVAVANTTPTENGMVLLYSASMPPGAPPLKSVVVGALPDMVTFTPDGRKLLVANEGEPGLVDPDGSVSVIDLSSGVAVATAATATFNRFNADELRRSGVRVFPGKKAAEDLEPEYISVSPDGKTAYVSLQEANAVAVLDIDTASFERILPLGTKDHRAAGNAIDPSDRDGGAHIGNWPVFGMYMPDSLASYNANGQAYFVTANEGESRGEAKRIGDLIIDAGRFPNARALQRDDRLGRLLVSTIDGDSDGDGDFDRLFAYGARSFSIWDAAGRQVFDSGDDFERITAERFPAFFNSDNDKPTFDTRSDAKGPEPEGVTVAKIDASVYAFIGLERVGGVMVYDVTEPSAVSLVEYVNPRDFARGGADPVAGDSGPEGLLIIAAAESPTGGPLLVVTNEVSGTTTIYSIHSTSE
ncbi:MAG: choice-of-anchor I family protein, partial [Planctomycetota bacterium]